MSDNVVVNLSGLNRFQRNVIAQSTGSPGPVHDAYKLWAVRYRSFAQMRFDAYSKGGGDWQKLAASTLKKRRKGKESNVKKLREIWKNNSNISRNPDITEGSMYSMLRDTGLLFSALTPVFVNSPGAIEEFVAFGVRVGYGGQHRHSDGPSKGTATIADIASFHQIGNPPNLPQRKIIVSPTDSVKSEMAEDMEKAFSILLKQ